MVKFLDLVSQYRSIKDEIDLAVKSTIDNASFIGGEPVRIFEEAFANFVNADYCVGVGNGTDALEIAIEALGLPEGSEIIVPANSFIASSESVTREGCKVVFCDICPETYVISIDDLEKRITPKTKAIMAVHLYGHPCDMGRLKEISEKNDLFLIEDCAQAHGAEYNGQKVGSIGDVATFSFYPGKNLGAYGDGGAITTNCADLAKKSRMIANHGRIAKYDHEFEGRNSRLDGLQAAILSVKLKFLPEWTSRRIEIADYYLNNLGDIKDIILPVRESWAKQVYHLFVIRVHDRDELKTFLEEKGVQTGVHYPISLPKLKAYDYLSQGGNEMVANQIDSSLLSLPIGDHLTEKDLRMVVTAIKEFYL